MVIYWDLMGCHQENGDLPGFNGISPRKMVIYWDLMGCHQEKW